jgi:hypothetical protein
MPTNEEDKKGKKDVNEGAEEKRERRATPPPTRETKKGEGREKRAKLGGAPLNSLGLASRVSK